MPGQLWTPWIHMALDSRDSANVALNSSSYRSAASRYYYAAFQAATALLHYCRQTPPIVEGVRREAWSHEVTPDLFEEQLKPFVSNHGRRQILRSKLRGLRKTRISADYISADRLEIKTVQRAKTDAGYIITAVRSILPELKPL
jgi:uncharacterized protein (UPF0332 family)